MLGSPARLANGEAKDKGEATDDGGQHHDSSFAGRGGGGRDARSRVASH